MNLRNTMLRSLISTAILMMVWSADPGFGLSQGIEADRQSEHDAAARTWNSSNGNHSIDAVLVDYDKVARVVTLKREDSSIIDVKLEQLSSSDRRFISREMRKRQMRGRESAETEDDLESDSDNPFAQNDQQNKAGNNIEKQRAESKVKPRVENNKTLYGVRWQPDIDDALLIATGKETERDDRPVMLFRVLGDLEGLM